MPSLEEMIAQKKAAEAKAKAAEEQPISKWKLRKVAFQVALDDFLYKHGLEVALSIMFILLGSVFSIAIVGSLK